MSVTYMATAILDRELKKGSAELMILSLLEYRPRHGLSELLGLDGKSQSRAMKIDLGIEMPKLEAGKAYFLYLP